MPNAQPGIRASRIKEPHLQNLKSLQIFLALAYLSGCSRVVPPARSSIAPCTALAASLAEQEAAFVARLKAIRAQHILVRDYDRLMIAALTERRASLRAVLLAESQDRNRSGCFGKPLEGLRLDIRQDLADLDGFIRTFNQALKTDSKDVFIDSL